jgi:kinesin family protein 5
MRMATSGGGNYRNGTYRSSLKVDKPLSLNSNPKSSVKSKPVQSSGPRRNSTGSLGAATGAAKDEAGGEFVVCCLC